MEQLVSGAATGLFAVINLVINIPLAVLIPSSSGHGALAMPLLVWPLLLILVVVAAAGVALAATLE